MMTPKRALPLGQLVITCAADAAFQASGDVPYPFINRHRRYDWGNVSADDAQANDDAVMHGRRVLSSYRLSDGTTVWIITEADRSVTTVLLPSD